MFDVCVCCDNIDERNNLNGFLLKFTSFHKFKYKLLNFNSLDDLLKNKPMNIDILFLSVNLENKNTALILNNKITTLYKDIKIVFIPEIINFMINGFSLKDSKYMLRPITYDTFNDELLKCIDNYNEDNTLNGVDTKSILYAESFENNVIIHTVDGNFAIDFSLNKLSDQLDSYIFYKCHDRFLVNLKQIRKLNKESLLLGDISIPISSNKFSELKTRLLYILNIKK